MPQFFFSVPTVALWIAEGDQSEFLQENTDDDDAIRDASFYNVDPDTLLILYFHHCDHHSHIVDYTTVFQSSVESQIMV